MQLNCRVAMPSPYFLTCPKITKKITLSEIRRDFKTHSAYTLCLKKTTMTFHAITSMHINRF